MGIASTPAHEKSIRGAKSAIYRLAQILVETLVILTKLLVQLKFWLHVWQRDEWQDRKPHVWKWTGREKRLADLGSGWWISMDCLGEKLGPEHLCASRNKIRCKIRGTPDFRILRRSSFLCLKSCASTLSSCGKLWCSNIFHYVDGSWLILCYIVM